MLHRIVVIGQTAAIARAAGNGFQVVSLQEHDVLPDGLAAIAGTRKDAARLVEAAVQMGAREEGVLKLIAAAADVRESQLDGSSLRVHAHAARFADALALAPDERFVLERAAFLRDVGKLRLPNDVLLKTGALTYDEYVLLQAHTTLGAELLDQLGIYRECADVVRFHHECWDGTGYPERLEGEAIPRLARVMKILDVYCAMTSPRTYRKGFASHEDAVDHLLSERGKHFDPELIDAFISGNVGQPWGA